jgi:hypothetical protein
MLTKYELLISSPVNDQLFAKESSGYWMSQMPEPVVIEVLIFMRAMNRYCKYGLLSWVWTCWGCRAYSYNLSPISCLAEYVQVKNH